MFNKELLANFVEQIKSLELPNLSEEDTQELLAIVGILSNAIFNIRLAHKVSIDIKNSSLDKDNQLAFEGDPDVNFLIQEFIELDKRYTKAHKEKISKYLNILNLILVTVPKALKRFKELSCIKEDNAPKIILLH